MSLWTGNRCATNRRPAMRWLWLMLVVLLGPAMSWAQDVATTAPDDPTPAETVTAQDTSIPVAELALIVKPMQADALAVEAAAWMALLQDKASQIAAAQVAVHRANEAMAEADEDDTAGAARTVREAAEQVQNVAEQAEARQAEAGETTDDAAQVAAAAERLAQDADRAAAQGADAVEAVANNAKQRMLDKVTELRSQQTALIDRLNVVLDSWEAKGGEVESYRRYIDVVSGIEVDVTDASATWAVVSGWLVSDEGGKRWLWNAVRFFAVLVGTWLVARLFGWLFHKAMARTVKGMSRLAEDAIIRSAKMLIWIIGLVIALAMLEIDITPLIAAIGAAGLVIGLALQGTLSNIASGVMILINRPFDVDDVVTAGGITGTVSQMTLVTTIFRTFDNQTVIVPNNAIWGQVITNITANRTRRIDMTFGVGYGDDLDLAERLIREVVDSHELVLKEPEPVIKVHQLGDSSVNFICRPWAKTTDYWTVLWDVTRQVKRRFDEEGVTIPFPQRDVHVHQVPPAKDGTESKP